MKTMPWRVPVADCGGITDLIKKQIRSTELPCWMERQTTIIRVHAYREVGSSLEVSCEFETDTPVGKVFTWETIIL